MHLPTRASFLVPFLALLLASGAAPARASNPRPPQTPNLLCPCGQHPSGQLQSPVNTQLPVNWLYGAYIPKDASLVALNGRERFKLYLRPIPRLAFTSRQDSSPCMIKCEIPRRPGGMDSRFEIAIWLLLCREIS